jgi:hypothetical protein
MHHVCTLRPRALYPLLILCATLNHDNYSDLNASGCIETLARRKCTMNLLNCIPVTLGYHQV